MPRVAKLLYTKSPAREEKEIKDLVEQALKESLEENYRERQVVAGFKEPSNKGSGLIGSALVGSGGPGSGRKKRMTKSKSMSDEKPKMGMKTKGTKDEVYHGFAKHTAGGLTKADLMMNAKGKVVSKAQHAAGKKAIQHMRK